ERLRRNHALPSQNPRPSTRRLPNRPPSSWSPNIADGGGASKQATFDFLDDVSINDRRSAIERGRRGRETRARALGGAARATRAGAAGTARARRQATWFRGESRVTGHVTLGPA